MQMRARRETAHADIADDFALLNVRTDPNVLGEARHMAVERRDVAAMGQHDRIAVAAPLAFEAHVSVAGSVHGRADGRRVVGSHMPTNEVQDRMEPVRIEYRS